MADLHGVSGVLCLDKAEGATSHDMIYKIRRLYRTKTVGHAGTLDPLATGLLPIMIGNSVKLSEYLMQHDKTYVAQLKLGIVTTTQDITGEVLSESDVIPSHSRVREVITSFVGKQTQIPPMYSAIKVGGKKLYELARDGVEIPREERHIEVYSIDTKTITPDTYELTIACSKGTYIRTICADIGAKLGCGGCMLALRRVVCGEFSIQQAHTLEELSSYTDEQLCEILIAPDKCLGYPELKLSEFYAKLARNGAEIYLKKIGLTANLDTRYYLYDANGKFFGIGEVREFEEGLAVKPVKIMV